MGCHATNRRHFFSALHGNYHQKSERRRKHVIYVFGVGEAKEGSAFFPCVWNTARAWGIGSIPSLAEQID